VNINALVLDKVEAIIRKGGDERGSMRLASVATQLFKLDEIRAYFTTRELPPKKGKWIVDCVMQDTARFGFTNDGPGLEEIALKGFVGQPRLPRDPSAAHSKAGKTAGGNRAFGSSEVVAMGPASVEDAQVLADAMETVMSQVGKSSRDVASLCLDLHRNYPHFKTKYPFKFGQVVLSVARSNPRFRVDGKTIYSNNGSAGDVRTARPEKRMRSTMNSNPSPKRGYVGSTHPQQPGMLSSAPVAESAPVQHRQLYPIFAPYFFSDVPSSLPFTMFETAYTVEVEIAIFGMEVKNVSFGSRALRVDLQPHKNLSQAHYHQPLGLDLPSLLVFISPDEFAEVISFVPGASTISIRFVRKN